MTNSMRISIVYYDTPEDLFFKTIKSIIRSVEFAARQALIEKCDLPESSNTWDV